jgi:methionyl aminopeptidase
MINIRSAAEIRHIEESCRIVALALRRLGEVLRPGITTAELAEEAEAVIEKSGGVVAFRGYRGFPGAICTSVNDEVVHGIPKDRRVADGDIVGIDVGVLKNGYYGDGACTFPVGEVAPDRRRLLEVTREALHLGVAQARPGSHLSDVSHIIQTHVESCGCSVVRDLCGHGIGSAMHEAPEVPNFGEPGRGPILKPGMVLAIEPMVNLGGYEVRVMADGWTVVTADGSPSSHFEHTVAVTAEGPRVLTRVGGEQDQEDN